MKISKRREEKGNDYIVKGLTELIAGNREKAFESFKKAIKYDPNFEIPYIYMGRIMRDKGFWRNALNLHSQLLVRKSLRRYTKESIYKEIVLDYIAGKDYENAFVYYKKIKDTDDMLEEYKKIISNLFIPEKVYSLLEKKKEGLGKEFLKDVIFNGYENKEDYKFTIKLADKGKSMPYSALIAGLIRYEEDDYELCVKFFLKALGYEAEDIPYEVVDILTDAAYKSDLMGKVEETLKSMVSDKKCNLAKEILFDISMKKGDYDSARLYACDDIMISLVELKEGNIQEVEKILRRMLK